MQLAVNVLVLTALYALIAEGSCSSIGRAVSSAWLTAT